jgi:hypothetical protein
MYQNVCLIVKEVLQMKKFIITSMLFVVLTLAACTSKTEAEETSTYVTMDMNPAVSFIIDEEDNVVLINALNEDGEILLFNLNVVGQNIEQALEMLIEEAGHLGFIDPEVETVIEVEVIGENTAIENAVRIKVETGLNKAFEERSLPVQVSGKVYDEDFIAEAQAKGLTAREYRLVKEALFANPELSMEEAVQMDTTELIEQVREHGQNISEFAVSLKDDFLAAKQEVFEEYLPQIEALEAQIEEAIANEEPTEELEAELEALQQEMHDALMAVVTDFVTQAQSIRDMIEQQYQDLRDEFEDRIPRP